MSGIGFFVDVFFVVFAIIIVAVNAKRGFVKNAMKLISFVLSVIIAATLAPMFTDYVSENWIKQNVNDYVAEQVISLSQQGGGTFDIAALFNEEQSDFMDLITRFGVDAEQLSETYNSITEGSEATVNELAHNIADKVVHAIASVIAYLLIFLASFVVLSLLFLIFGLATKLPVIKQINTFLGFVCGVVIAVAFVYVFATVGVFFLEKLHALYPDVIPANIREESFILTHCSGMDAIIKLILGSGN